MPFSYQFSKNIENFYSIRNFKNQILTENDKNEIRNDLLVRKKEILNNIMTVRELIASLESKLENHKSRVERLDKDLKTIKSLAKITFIHYGEISDLEMRKKKEKVFPKDIKRYLNICGNFMRMLEMCQRLIELLDENITLSSDELLCLNFDQIFDSNFDSNEYLNRLLKNEKLVKENSFLGCRKKPKSFEDFDDKISVALTNKYLYIQSCSDTSTKVSIPIELLVGAFYAYQSTSSQPADSFHSKIFKIVFCELPPMEISGYKEISSEKVLFLFNHLFVVKPVMTDPINTKLYYYIYSMKCFYCYSTYNVYDIFSDFIYIPECAMHHKSLAVHEYYFYTECLEEILKWIKLINSSANAKLKDSLDHYCCFDEEALTGTALTRHGD